MPAHPRTLSARTWHLALNAAIIAVACMVTLPACHAPQSAKSPETDHAPTAQPAATSQLGTTTLKSPFTPILRGTTAVTVPSVRSFRDVISQYPASEKAQIIDWYALHAAGSMTFDSSAQWQWMQEHGYPTPGDVLRASSISDARLHELAIQGDTKANFFYLARLLDDDAQALASSTAIDPSRVLRHSELTASMDRALASGSAFAGYMFDNYYATLHGKNMANVGMAAGLSWVDTLGDPNGPFHSGQMAIGFPGVSGVHAAEVYFDMFATAARMNPAFMNTYGGRGESSMPVSTGDRSTRDR